jgi:hypothetical protein
MPSVSLSPPSSDPLPPSDDRHWRAARLLTAAHRLGFFAAAALMAASAGRRSLRPS